VEINVRWGNKTCPMPNQPGISQSVGNAFIGLDDIGISENICSYPSPSVSSNSPVCGLQTPVTFTATYPFSPFPASLSYQWFKKLGNNQYQEVVGATSATFTVPTPAAGTALPHTVDYYVCVRDNDGRSNMVLARAVFNAPMTAPVVQEWGICQGVSTSVTLTVSNVAANTEYHWYSSPTGGQANELTPSPTSTYTVTVNSARTVYVQAIPQGGGNTSCPSDIIPVSIVERIINPAFGINAGFSGQTPYLAGNYIRFEASQSGYNSYTWNWGDGTPNTTTTTSSADHVFAANGSANYVVTLTISHAFPNTSGGPCSRVVDLPIAIVEPLCQLFVAPNGNFARNQSTGALTYTVGAGECTASSVLECLGEQGTNVPGLVSAAATSYSDRLVPTPDGLLGTTNYNPFLQGQGFWQPQASYTYQTELTAGVGINYIDGTFSMTPFDWQSSVRARPNRWLATAVTDFNSPDGEVLQEHNPLGIVSTAKFGYGTNGNIAVQALPYLKAQNAAYSTVLFESFESIYISGGQRFGEDKLPLLGSEISQIVTTKAHTGTASLELRGVSNAWKMTLKAVPRTAQLNARGLAVKAWVQIADYVPAQLTASVKLLDNSGVVLLSTPFTTTIRTGEWQLFEAVIPVSSLPSGASATLAPQLFFTGTGATKVWVDDIRMQPQDAQMTTYVYSPLTFKLLASFDDQHFALRYQYNEEGKLTRKQAETSRGLKTVQETQYHIPSTSQVE
jgi:YD repeat-containing protein